MPFLLVKREAEAWPAIDEREVAARLCPYEGPLARVDLGPYRLYHTRLGAARDEAGTRTFAFPPETRFEPHGAWARIRFEGGRCTLETDPMGQVPLWRHDGRDFKAWSPESKAFGAIAGAMPLWQPDTLILKSEVRDRRYSPYLNLARELPASLAPRFTPRPAEEAFSDFGEAIAALGGALETAAGAFELDGALGAFLSGGIDSSTAAALLARRRGGFKAFTLGTALADEYADAAELATWLGLAPVRVALGPDDLLARWSRVIHANEVYDGMSAEILMQSAALCEAAGERVRQVVTGYGSDLLFGGMLGHQAYLDAVGVSDTAGLIERTRWSMELSPFSAWAAGVRQVHLFWHPAVIEVAMRIPPALAAEGGIEKAVLRETAVRRGWLARPLAYRPKLGMTLGTGVNRWLSERLGLLEPYAYPAKSADALRRLQAAVATGRPA